MERNLGGMSEAQLYDAAARGDVAALQELLKQDPLLLVRVSHTRSNKTPLHIATIHGHLPFVQAILNQNPDLSQELDSHQSSPLHAASSRGHLEIAGKLLSAAPDMVLSRDCRGWNPVHLAAAKGHAAVLTELLQSAPAAAACEKIDRGSTALHLCVKYEKLEALKVVVGRLGDAVVNEKDDDGDTALHIAVRERRRDDEIIKYLVKNTNIDLNAKNSKGQTPLAILGQSNPSDEEITELLTPKSSGTTTTAAAAQPVKWLTKKRDSIMVVAILIATMAFQAGVTPPGGVWQDNADSHRAGEAVMAHNHPKAYKSFIRSNTVAFVSSLSTILLLISGLPFRRRFFMWALMVIMWLTVTSTAVTYAISVVVVTPKKDMGTLRHVIEIALAVWCGVMGILLVGNTLRLIDKWLKNKGVVVWRPRRFSNFVIHENGGGQESV